MSLINTSLDAKVKLQRISRSGQTAVGELTGILGDFRLPSCLRGSCDVQLLAHEQVRMRTATCLMAACHRRACSSVVHMACEALVNTSASWNVGVSMLVSERALVKRTWCVARCFVRTRTAPYSNDVGRSTVLHERRQVSDDTQGAPLACRLLAREADDVCDSNWTCRFLLRESVRLVTIQGIEWLKQETAIRVEFV